MQFISLSIGRMFAEGGAQRQASPGELLLSMALPLAFIGLMYFFMIRPQRKQEKERKEQLNKLKVGDEVITIGGLLGRVVSIKDQEITIASSVANTLMTFRKEAIEHVLTASPEAEDNAKLKDKKDSSSDAEKKEKPSLRERLAKEREEKAQDESADK